MRQAAAAIGRAAPGQHILGRRVQPCGRSERIIGIVAVSALRGLIPEPPALLVTSPTSFQTSPGGDAEARGTGSLGSRGIRERRGFAALRLSWGQGAYL